MNLELSRAEEILQEFVSDVEAAGGPRAAGKEWPDLVVTYRKAKRHMDALKALINREPPRCHRCGFEITDPAHAVEPDGTFRHLNACPI